MKKIYVLVLLSFSTVGSIAQSLPGYVPTSGLQAWYSFSGNANNGYGPVYDGRVTGATLVADRFGQPNSAYYFHGDTDKITIDTAFFDVGWSEYTISFWYKSDTNTNPYNSNSSQVMVNTLPHNGIDLSFNWRNNGKYGMFVGSDPAMRVWDILPGQLTDSPATTHVWRHVVFTKQRDTVYSFYLDGVLDTTYTSPILANNYLCKMVMGNTDSSVGNEGSWGTLDDYGYWNRALEGCELAKLFDTASYNYITTAPTPVASPVGTNVRFTVAATGTGNTYQWQKSVGGSYTNIAATLPYSGVTTPTLTITAITAPLNGTKYRCVVRGALPCTDTSVAAMLTVLTTSVQNVTQAATITIAPNPTGGDINIIGAGEVDVQVYNMLGQRVKSATKVASVSIADLPIGTYTIKLMSADGLLLYNGQVMRK